MQKFRGTFVVTITPFTDEDELNEDGLRDNVNWFIGEGIRGVICSGSTGEFDCLSEKERKRVIDITVDQVNGKVPVLAGTAAPSTKETIKWTKYARDVGADGAMIVHPYYCPPTENEVYEHFKTVAETVDIPIMIYNNPWCSGFDMKPELVAKLAELENISYIKESTADVKRVHEIKRFADDKITVFCGWDDIALESFVLGAEGWVSATANVIPKLAKELFELVADKKDIQKATELYYKILPLCTFIENSGKFVQVVKTGVSLRGRAAGPTRRPKLPLTEEQEAKLRRILRDIGVLGG